MMRSSVCEQARSWVSLRLDGALSEFERIRLDRHLERCASCAAFGAEIGATTQVLREAPLIVPTAPVELPARRSARHRNAAAAAFAAAAAALAAVVALHPGSTVRRTTAGAAVARPAGLALISADGTNLGVRRRDLRNAGSGGSDSVRGKSQLPAY
jgi:predicted anti-sigma-YlaC factor YlaD